MDEGVPVETDFAVDDEIVYCKMQVTGLQYLLCPGCPFIDGRSVVSNDLHQWNGSDEI
jgi:hypothetical protein